MPTVAKLKFLYYCLQGRVPCLEAVVLYGQGPI